jgi:hypothetical protein
MGIAAFGEIPAPCPALREHDGRFWCGVVEQADQVDVGFGSYMRWTLGIGLGCDADFTDGETT